MPIARVFLAMTAALLVAGCGAGQQAAEQAPLRSGVDLDALDRSTRPQDDFYQFANGGWLDSTEIPTIYTGYTVYHEVNERVEEALRGIIELAAAESGLKGTEAQQVGDIYASWMDVDTINAAGVAPVADDLEIVASVDSIESLSIAIAKLMRRGVDVPFGVAVWPDLRDSSQYAVYVGQGGITMPNRDYYLQRDNENFAKAREELTPFIADMLVISGMDDETAADAAARIYEFEHALAEAQWDSVTNRDPQKTYNPYATDGLDALGPNFDWQELLEALSVQDQERLIVSQPSFFEAVDAMAAEVPLDTWRDYLTYRVMNSRALHLDEAAYDRAFAYLGQILYGQQEKRPRWKRGIDMVDELVGEAVGKLYVAEHFPPEAKAKMEELVGNVIATLDDSLDELAWMSPETRARAKEKLSKFTPKIGYPDVWKDYSALEIVAGDHLGNVRRAIEWGYLQQIDKLGGPIDRTEWFMTPQNVNAYYDPTKNEIVFPAARLQPPFFQLDADDAINYGAVGGVIGHEISHGFDDKGSQFDGDGNLNNWWTEEDRAAFDAKTRVIAEQFSAFEPVEGMNINGELTLGENIGDLSGIAMAYRAYIRSLNGEEPPVIDGFTGAQRFFIGYAMSRKGKYHKETIISRLTSAPHSPLEFRVNGPYPNIDAFHEAFETQPGDGMWLPPEERVRIW